MIISKTKSRKLVSMKIISVKTIVASTSKNRNARNRNKRAAAFSPAFTISLVFNKDFPIIGKINVANVERSNKK